MTRRGRTRATLLAVVLAVVMLVMAACTGGSGSSDPDRPARQGGGDETSTTRVERPRGGSVRVGVWMRPDPDGFTVGGAAVRALVLPQLFTVTPRGEWEPALVQPGSDQLAPDRKSASFRLREEAYWSDGTPITADDLRRAADPMVAGVDGPGADGRITVRFTQPLAEWRRLWSHTASVAPPGPGVWGGPFLVASHVPGLETVLARNDRWWGPGPWLDEVRLVVVPDATTAGHLLERGELDVLAPLPATHRAGALEAMDGVEVATGPAGGWWFGLHLNPDRLAPAHRHALVAAVLREDFVTTLLRGEAHVLHGLAGPEDATWASVAPGSVAGLGRRTVDLVGMVEEPMLWLVHRSMQQRANEGAGARLELRTDAAHLVEGWLGERDWDAALVSVLDPPRGCWACRWNWLDHSLAAAADAGDPAAVVALQARLRDEALLLPIWQPRAVTAWRPEAVAGIRPNAWAPSPAWNAWEWWSPATGD